MNIKLPKAPSCTQLSKHRSAGKILCSCKIPQISSGTEVQENPVNWKWILLDQILMESGFILLLFDMQLHNS